MDARTYAIRQCTQCGLRFPVVDHESGGEKCPHCAAATMIVARHELVREAPHTQVAAPMIAMDALLDNIRSAWNVGSMFRSADGLGVRRLHLCGITPFPPHDGITKTALGAELAVPWQYHKSAIDAGRQLKAEGFRLLALEHAERAVPIAEAPDAPPGPKVLLVGNEIAGIDPELVELCDEVVYIPMLGRKRSLNVAVAFGIAVHTLAALQRTSG